MEFRTVPEFCVPGGGDLVSGESINRVGRMVLDLGVGN